MVRISFAALMLVLVASACGPRPLSQGESTSSQGTTAMPVPKVATLGLDEDLRNLWNAVTDGGGGGEGEKVLPVVHQPLAANTADGSAQPRLLRAATWHDGTPFSARDVIFSYQVYRDPDLPNSRQNIVKFIASMEQADPTTVVVRWSEAYPYADRLELRELLILPAYILESTYLEAKQQLLSQPYFSSNEYVGLGPFRIAAWEPGSHLDLVAFDQFFLGRPRLDRIQVKFIPDMN